MKKIISTSLIALVMSATALSAQEAKNSNFAIGLSTSLGGSVAMQIAGLNIGVGGGASVDYLFLDKNIVTNESIALNWYVGAGGAYFWGNAFGGNSINGDILVRVPVGLSMMFAKDWEIFGELDPGVRFNHGTDFGIDSGIGFRYHF